MDLRSYLLPLPLPLVFFLNSIFSGPPTHPRSSKGRFPVRPPLPAPPCHSSLVPIRSLPPGPRPRLLPQSLQRRPAPSRWQPMAARPRPTPASSPAPACRPSQPRPGALAGVGPPRLSPEPLALLLDCGGRSPRRPAGPSRGAWTRRGWRWAGGAWTRLASPGGEGLGGRGERVGRLREAVTTPLGLCLPASPGVPARPWGPGACIPCSPSGTLLCDREVWGSLPSALLPELPLVCSPHSCCVYFFFCVLFAWKTWST